MAARRILVTGAAGFLGRALFEHLRRSAPGAIVRGAARRKAAGVFVCDFSRAGRVAALARRFQPDVVFHCAGTSAAGPEQKLFDAHVASTLGLLEGLHGAGIRPPRVVVVGSAAEYGSIPPSRQPIRESEPVRPASPYAVSKRCQTDLALVYAERGLPVVVARVFNLIGPGMPEHLSVGRFAALLRRRPKTLRTGPLSAWRDFLSIDDACAALWALGRRGRPGEIYNVCSGTGVRLSDVLHEMVRLAGAAPSIVEERRPDARGSAARAVGDPSKIRRHAGWRPKDDWKAALRKAMAR